MTPMTKPSQEIFDIFMALQAGELDAERFPSADNGAIIQAIIHWLDLHADRFRNEDLQAKRGEASRHSLE